MTVPEPPRRIPHRIETERLVVRCYEPSDAQALRDVCAANREHLVTFLPWARDDPQTLDQKLELILGFRGRYDLGTNHVMGIFERGSGRLLGGTGLHPPRSSVGKEIGYWIAAESEGHGFVTEAVSALCFVALRLGQPLVSIRMVPENQRSIAVCERIGLVREGLLRQSIQFQDDSPRDSFQYTLLPDELESVPWLQQVETSVRAFDSLGRPVDLSPAAPADR